MNTLKTTTKTNPIQSWILAARPKSLTASIVPIISGTILAKTTVPLIEWNLMFFGLLAALFIQIGTNLVNDALDFKKGADTSARIGPKRATQSGLLSFKQVYSAGIFCFVLALLFSIPLILKGGMVILALMILSVACGYLYTGGPYPLAYVGIADLFVIIFFGFVSTGMMYYVQTGFINGKALLAGFQIGLLATVLIAINNMRDRDGDAKAHKKTLPVRFGIDCGRWEVTITAFLPFLLNLGWLYYDLLLPAILPFIALPVAISIVRFVWITEPGVMYNRFFGMSAILHFSFGVFLILALVLS